ncbi:MAG: M61 family metallopeptidase [Bryobacteraceae bacterium]
MLSRYLLVFAALPLLSEPTVRYQLSFPNAVHHEAEVEAVFEGVPGSALDVLMSRASPGRYALHEFAKNVYSVRVTDGDGRELKPIQIDPSTWRVEGHKGTVRFHYTLFGDRTDGTYAGIDETHAHLNMPATLVWARGLEKAPVTVHFVIPEGKNWKIATQLVPQKDGGWFAPNLDRLMDGPAELSVHDTPEWRTEDARFRVALHHTGTPAEAAKFAQMCQAVVLEEEGVFGALPKYHNGTYTFLLDVLPYAFFDGMEHRDSTVITGVGDVIGGRGEGMIGAAAHEFFHSWNVKRLRPKTLEPFDYEKANMSGELWFAEGFTNYYGPLALERSGISKLSQFARSMGNAVNAVLNSPGRLVHSPAEMSRMAPFVDAATSIDERNFGNTYISYYTYGQALAFGLDLIIREQFRGNSLDDWMRTVWHEHPDADRPYTLADLERALAETTGDSAFARQFFERHVTGKEPLDYKKAVGAAGLVLRKAHSGKAWWGKEQIAFSPGGGEIKSATAQGSPLYGAGLERGDRILSVDGNAIGSDTTVDNLLSKHKLGDDLTLRVQTRGGERDARVRVAEDPQVEIVTFEEAGLPITPEIKGFREAWLGSKALHPLPKLEPLK